MGIFNKFISSLINAVTTPLLTRNKEFQRLKSLTAKLEDTLGQSTIHPQAVLYSPYKVLNTEVGRYSYISGGAKLSMVTIGQFCSIGPNLFVGHGIHPINGISTAPMFYSTGKQNGISISATDKVVERKHIHIGNDVFIGANVTILDGVSIGDGAVIGAGAVVSKDIPAYAIAVGVPAKIIKYRFDEPIRTKLIESQWWNWSDDKLPLIESRFFDLEMFLSNLPQSL